MSCPARCTRERASWGLIGLTYPAAVGGGAGDAIDSVTLAEEFHYAGGSSGAFASLFTSGISLPHLVSAGDAAQLERWVRPTIEGTMIGSLAITEPDGGSDVAGIRTTAKRCQGSGGDEYVIDGAKDLHHLGRAGRLRRHRGAHRRHRRARHLARRVERGTPGFTVSRRLEKMGWLCSDTAELSYADVRVPASNLVGGENSGFVQIAQNFVSERIGLAVQSYACAQRALDLTVRWCRDRETFGRPLISRARCRTRSPRWRDGSRSRASTPAPSRPGQPAASRIW